MEDWCSWCRCCPRAPCTGAKAVPWNFWRKKADDRACDDWAPIAARRLKDKEVKPSRWRSTVWSMKMWFTKKEGHCERQSSMGEAPLRKGLCSQASQRQESQSACWNSNLGHAAANSAEHSTRTRQRTSSSQNPTPSMDLLASRTRPMASHWCYAATSLLPLDEKARLPSEDIMEWEKVLALCTIIMSFNFHQASALNFNGYFQTWLHCMCTPLLLHHPNTLACCVSVSLWPVNLISNHTMTDTYCTWKFCPVNLTNENQASITYLLAKLNSKYKSSAIKCLFKRIPVLVFQQRTKTAPQIQGGYSYEDSTWFLDVSKALAWSVESFDGNIGKTSGNNY